MEQASLQGFRLSPQQKYIWMLQSDRMPFTAQCAILLEGNLELEQLKAALQVLVDRQAILRTTFRRLPSIKTPLQYPADKGSVRWQEVDLRATSADNQHVTLKQLLRDECRQPFDLQQGPVIHATLAALSAVQHVLVLTLPALCADATTLSTLTTDLWTAYGGGLAQDGDEIVQYVQFSEWQNELLIDEEGAAGKQYWQQRSALPAFTLPFQAQATQPTEGACDSVAFAVASDVATKIKQLAAAYGSSTTDFLLACWLITLWRLTGQHDLVVGAVVDGRKFDELRTAYGLFAKTVPVRGEIEPGMTFDAVLKRAAKVLAEAYEQQEYLVWDDQAKPVPLAVSFELTEWPVPQAADELRFSVYKQHATLDGAVLQLCCVWVNQALTLELRYDPAALQCEQVASIARSFTTLLNQIVAAPHTPLDQLEILTEADRHELVIALNATSAAYPQHACIHELFAQQAEQTPDVPAVIFADMRLTYRELNERANQVAHFLKRHGVEPDVRVGLCLERSVEMVIGLLGVLKAGGAYVPLDPDNPKARLAYQIEDSQPSIVLTQERLIAQLPELGQTSVCLDRDAAQIAREAVTNPEATALPQHLAYIIYTSGSTGLAKGVAITHQSLVNYTHFIRSKLAVQPGMNFATVSTIGADLGNTVIFPALVGGGSLHILTYEVATDSVRYGRYMAEQQIDVLKIAPSHLNTLLASQPNLSLPRKYLILGGETLSHDLLQRIREAAPDCRVINHYGPTETTVGALTFDVRDHESILAAASSVPIGNPIANSQAYILDRHLRPTPIGVPGELYLGGAGIARGYLNQPAQTAERFIPHPFSSGNSGPEDTSAGARLYKTGDLARYLPSGHIEFLGRADHQIKIRGFRVELGEIEATLVQHPAVRAAVVIAQQDGTHDLRLVAYVVESNEPGISWTDKGTSERNAESSFPAAAGEKQGPRTGSESLASSLRFYLKERLPEHMIPGLFIPLAALPLTHNGKINRAALPDPDNYRPVSEVAYVMPRNEIEQTIAALWKDLLRVERVGVNDNFFDLGGHSLLMVQVHSKLREQFHKDLSIADLFKYPTVSALANYLSQEHPTPPTGEQSKSRAQARRESIRQQATKKR